MKARLLFYIACFASLASSSAEEIQKEKSDVLQNIEKLKIFSEEWTEAVQKFLKTSAPSDGNSKDQTASRHWLPPLPEMLDVTVETDRKEFDYIVVGCGTAGCPLAGTISTYAKDAEILVLERGLPRSHQNTPEAMNIWGAGLSYTNPDYSQVFITQQGVRTFSAAITGGSSSINLGEFAVEDDAYFEHLTTLSGVPFDELMLAGAKEWITFLSGFNMPSSKFGKAFSQGLLNQGIDLFGATTPPPTYSDTVKDGFQWSGQSTFFPERDFPRLSADTLIFDLNTGELPSNMTVDTQKTVEKIDFDTSVSPPVARCVVYHKTTKFDLAKNGKTGSPFNLEPTYVKPFFEAFLDPVHAFDEVEKGLFGLSVLKAGRRRVCVKPGGKIIVSAGPIHTPLLLFNSGIGPQSQIALLNRELIAAHESIGQEAIDRVTIPVIGFLEEGPTVEYHGAGATPDADDSTDTRETLSSHIHNSAEKLKNLFKPDNISSRFWNAGSIPQLSNLLNPVGSLPNMANMGLPNLPQLGEHLGNKNLGPFTPGTKSGNSFFGFLPKGVNPYFESKMPTSQSEFGIIPDFTVRFDFPQPGLTEPRIGEILSLKNQGTDCSGFSIGGSSLTCTPITATSHYGGRIAEGLAIATRYMLPPMFRDDPLVDGLMRVLKDCSNDIAPYNNPVLIPLCELAKPTLSCMRRQVTQNYYVAQPKSKGQIKLLPNGLVFIDGNYLADEQDFMDAIRGVSNLIDVFNSDVYSGVLQRSDSPFACPYSILNGFLDILTTFGMQTTPIVDAKNLSAIQKSLQELIPAEYRTSRRLQGVSERNVFEILRSAGSRREQEIPSEEKPSSKQDAEGTHEPLDLASMPDSNPELTEAIQECFVKNENSKTLLKGTCKRTNVCCTAYGNTKCISLTETQKGFLKKWIDNVSSFRGSERYLPNNIDISSIGQTGMWFSSLEGDYFSDLLSTPNYATPSDQWAASFPPVLPRSDMPAFVGKYAKTFMSSANSFVNTVPLGKAVDKDFNVIGTQGLAVIDQSVLNAMPKADPTATTMTLGIYGAYLLLLERGITPDSLLPFQFPSPSA